MIGVRSAAAHRARQKQRNPAPALRAAIKAETPDRIEGGWNQLSKSVMWPVRKQGHPELLGEPTYADAILDRIVHNAHRIELDGETIRNNRARAAKKE
jgi:IstB-like ATP binding protein